MDAKRAAEVIQAGMWPPDEAPEAVELATQALEAWAWVERMNAMVKRRQQNGWMCVTVGWSRATVGTGQTPLAAVLDAMGKEAKGS